MGSSQRMDFANSIIVEKDFKVSQEDRLKLQATPLHLCGSLLKELAGEDYIVYPGSHHISVIDDKGHMVLLLREIGYY
jgi:hypothetical protein